MAILHIHIAHAAAVHPRTARLRKRRDRELRAIRPSRANELWYLARLMEIVDLLRAAGRQVADDVRREWARAGADASVAADAAPQPASFDVALGEAARKFGRIEEHAKELTNVHDRLSLVRRNLGAVDARLAAAIKASVTIDISHALTLEGPISGAMERAAQANVELITSIPGQYLEQVKNAVSEAWAKGARWETLVDDIGQIGDVTESRAELIAQDQTQKLNAAFNRVRQTDLGIARYSWAGMLDQRERTSHIEMEGSIQRWDSPPLVDGEHVHPGEAVRCRCGAIPRIDLDDVQEAA